MGVRFGIESVHARWDSKITTGITGTISLRTSCALYLVVVVVARETVRFEDEEDFMKTLKALFYIFFSRKVNTVIFINGGSTLSRSPQNDKTSNLDNLFPALRHSR